MSNDMVVGSIRSTATPPLAGGIYEALLEKAERELDATRKENKRLEVFAANIHAELTEARKETYNLQDQRDLAMRMAKEREKERDHYKQALEEISTTIQEYKDSMVQEPAEDFIHAIKAWADKKLKEL